MPAKRPRGTRENTAFRMNEAFNLLRDGHSPPKVASILGVHPNTVDNYMRDLRAGFKGKPPAFLAQPKVKEKARVITKKAVRKPLPLDKATAEAIAKIKPAAAQELVQAATAAIESKAAGRLPILKRTSTQFRLAPAEKAVMFGFAAGMSVRRIARSLNCPESTVSLIASGLQKKLTAS